MWLGPLCPVVDKPDSKVPVALTDTVNVTTPLIERAYDAGSHDMDLIRVGILRRAHS